MTSQIRKKQLPTTQNLILDDFETKIEASVARGEWQSVKNSRALKQLFEEAARRHKELQTSKKITVRVNQKDLIRLKAKAKRGNIPYQTLLGALIRDFVDGDYSIRL